MKWRCRFFGHRTARKKNDEGDRWDQCERCSFQENYKSAAQIERERKQELIEYEKFIAEMAALADGRVIYCRGWNDN